MSTRAASAQRARGAAPTTPEYREEPLWWEGVSFPEPPASALPDSADVVIIGAGYTGLAAALELCRHGVRPLVLDCRELGRGASGRNAGMVHGGLRLDRATLQRRHGAAGVALHEAATAAHDFIARLAPQVAPDCDYRDTGWLYLAHRQVQLRRLRSRAAAGAGQSRFSNRMLSVEQLREETAAAGFHGGLLSSAGSSLHPGWYLAGLARAAMHAGATVRTGARVRAVTRQVQSRGFVVDTGIGRVRARHVLAATNGYTDAALPQLRRRVIPIGSYIIATEPLPDDTAHTVSAHRRVMTDTRNFLHYWRLTADQRLVFGGRASFAPTSLTRARDQLYAAMVTMYRQLAGVRVTHAWSGNVGFTFDRMPHIGRMDGITYAMGYCGSGVAMGTWLGTLAARWIASRDESDAPPFASLPFPGIVGYRGNPWFLPAAGLWYQLRDRFF